MANDELSRLSRAPARSTWFLTLLSCALVVAAATTEHRIVLVLLAVSLALTMAAAIQTAAVAPLAAEILRLREQLAKRG